MYEKLDSYASKGVPYQLKFFFFRAKKQNLQSIESGWTLAVLIHKLEHQSDDTSGCLLQADELFTYDSHRFFLLEGCGGHLS
ncbi:hypothetical protein BLD44_018770 [Mastigocladus laminosus UU774]|nr:MAG: hypothetical protein C6Y22_04185 [Hapalosiphonaceae cyanobacterium JJU2]TBR57254.1 hypothetical protein B4U84_14560 [Westiellopsis prolifica IICB1]TFI52770.1 hypothetical protein BLD44_018770 [Mastigocladus laminosus UU774]